MALIQTTQKQTCGFAFEFRIHMYASNQGLDLSVSGRVLSGACAESLAFSTRFCWAALRSATLVYCFASALRMPRRSDCCDCADSRCELARDVRLFTDKVSIGGWKVRIVLPSLSTAWMIGVGRFAGSREPRPLLLELPHSNAPHVNEHVPATRTTALLTIASHFYLYRGLISATAMGSARLHQS